MPTPSYFSNTHTHPLFSIARHIYIYTYIAIYFVAGIKSRGGGHCETLRCKFRVASYENCTRAKRGLSRESVSEGVGGFFSPAKLLITVQGLISKKKLFFQFFLYLFINEHPIIMISLCLYRG